MKQEWMLRLGALADLFYPLAEVTFLGRGGVEEGIECRTTPDGRQVKVLRWVIEGEGVEIVFDPTLFRRIGEQLAPLYVGLRQQPGALGREQIIGAIHDFLAERRVTVEGASRAQKRQLVQELYRRGLFDIKDSSKIVADALNTSRSTIYNYLNGAKEVRQIRIHQVDTFTDKQFGGNPAGVVLDADALDEETMRQITREMNLSETSFVLHSEVADCRLRYFTPTGDEVSFCGHSTVGALYMLAHEQRLGMNEPGHYALRIETGVGILAIEIDIADDETVQVAYEAPKIVLEPSNITHSEIATALGIPERVLDRSQPIMWEATNKDLFCSVKSLEALMQLKVDVRSATAFTKERGIVAICLLTLGGVDPKTNAHIRCYAPAVGIPEDPFTGSVQGGLAAYLHANGMVKGSKIVVEQGHAMGRPGSVRIQLSVKGGYHAWIRARAVHFFSTEIHLS